MINIRRVEEVYKSSLQKDKNKQIKPHFTKPIPNNFGEVLNKEIKRLKK